MQHPGDARPLRFSDRHRSIRLWSLMLGGFGSREGVSLPVRLPRRVSVSVAATRPDLATGKEGEADGASDHRR